MAARGREALGEKTYERVDGVDVRRGRLGQSSELDDGAHERVDLERAAGFDVLQHRRLVLADLLGAGNALVDADAERNAELVRDGLCFAHHLDAQLSREREG